jgi:hypothetical protein
MVDIVHKVAVTLVVFGIPYLVEACFLFDLHDHLCSFLYLSVVLGNFLFVRSYLGILDCS